MTVLLTSFNSGEDLRRLKEAMGRGCVPVLAGGDLPDIVVNEHSGFGLPRAAAPELTSVLAHFAGDERLRRAIIAAAYNHARRGAPRTTEMVWAYAEMFEEARSFRKTISRARDLV